MLRHIIIYTDSVVAHYNNSGYREECSWANYLPTVVPVWSIAAAAIIHVIRPLAVCIITYLLNKNRLHNFKTTQFEPKTTRRAAATAVKQ